MNVTVPRPRPSIGRETLLRAVLVANTELLLVLAYVALAPVTIVDPVYVAIPFVWLNVAAWAVLRVDVPDVGRRAQYAGLAVAVGYAAVLAVAGGVVGPAHATGATFDVHWLLPPGWGPLLSGSVAGVQVLLFPYKVAGYAALAYLVYATVLDAAAGAVGGVLGLFACVSCAWPVIGTVVTGVFGSGSVLAATATQQPYHLSTAVFVTAVALLVWRPTR
jgi:hypothetical protein